MSDGTPQLHLLALVTRRHLEFDRRTEREEEGDATVVLARGCPDHKSLHASDVLLATLSDGGGGGGGEGL